MGERIRPIESRDVAEVADLSVRAWAPVFDSMRTVLGERVFTRLYPDWRKAQHDAVRDVCLSETMSVWVSVDDEDCPVGFVAVLRHDDGSAAIDMLAVDPAAQRAGLGTALTRHAINWMRDHDITLAIVETGNDPGHAPARRTYEGAGFTKMPIARYFMVLS